MNENEISVHIVDCAVQLHKDLGPGLFESVYEITLAHLLQKRGLLVERQVEIPIDYDGLHINDAFRADIIVNKLVIIELKSLEVIRPVHKKQLLTYLKLTDLKLGMLLNFGEALMKDGISRVANGYF